MTGLDFDGTMDESGIANVARSLSKAAHNGHRVEEPFDKYIDHCNACADDISVRAEWCSGGSIPPEARY